MGLFAASVIFALLQAASPAASSSTRTIDFWVTGDKGEPVEGLGADEVVVLEDGTARAVTRVVRDTRPLTMAILVDSSAPMASTYRLHLVDAVGGFVRKLPEGARYAIWTTGDRPQKIVDVTDDRGRAALALRKVMPAGGNVVFDALVEAAGELEEREAERTLMVVVTGVGIGFANRSRQHVVDEVKRRRVRVMAVQFDERGSSEFGAAGSDQVERFDYDYVLGTLARADVYERPLSAMGVETALDKVAAALAGSHRATYATPETGKRDKLEVQVARPGVKVHVAGDAR
jgi:von Willebrand factor type A domain